MALDFIATFPFDEIEEDALYTRLIRLTRLSKLINLLDTGRVKRMIKTYFDNSSRQTQVIMYSYKIFRLVMIVLMITYFIGCSWWFAVTYINSDDDIRNNMTFIRYF